MSVADENISPDSRGNLVPRFKSSAPFEAERDRMDWIERGTVRIVHGIKTRGGFYIHRPKSTAFSFAVEEILPIGQAENARPFPLRPGQSVAFRQLHYRQLDIDQRAGYLRWLSAA